MGSYFKGWTDTLPNIPPVTPQTVAEEVYLGHVISVDYTNEVGKIKVRILSKEIEPFDEDVTTEAYPADRNIIKYPIPGETVVLIQSIENKFRENELSGAYFYLTVVSSDHDILYNSDAFSGQTVQTIIADKVFNSEYAIRFEKKLVNSSRFINSDGTLKERRPLQPKEGDVILQGRFGAAIRLGSTGTGNPWSSKNSSSGDPIMVISANKKDSDKQRMENVNTDACSIYFTSTQVVKAQLASSELRTHAVKYNLKGVKQLKDEAAFLQSKFIPGQMGSINVLATGGYKRISMNAERSTNITGLIAAFNAAGMTNPYWQIGMLACISKETGFIAKSEYSYKNTGIARLRELFGNRFREYENGKFRRLEDNEVLNIAQDDVKFYDYIYGYKMYPQKPGYSHDGSWDTGNSKPGDGYKYRGRGYNGITFKALYQKYSDLTGIDFVTYPDRLNEPQYGNVAAAKFFLNGLNGGKINEAGGTMDGLGKGFTNIPQAVYAAVFINHGGHRSVQNSEGLNKAMTNATLFTVVNGKVTWQT